MLRKDPLTFSWVSKLSYSAIGIENSVKQSLTRQIVNVINKTDQAKWEESQTTKPPISWLHWDQNHTDPAYLGKCRRTNHSQSSDRVGTCYQPATPSLKKTRTNLTVTVGKRNFRNPNKLSERRVNRNRNNSNLRGATSAHCHETKRIDFTL